MPGLAVSFLRTARAEPGAGSPAISRQRATCRQAAATLGAELVAEFVDDGVSGATLDRPGLGACLARLERQPAVTYLLVTEFSRLGRGVDRQSGEAVALEVARLVSARGAALHLATDRRDPLAAADGLRDRLVAVDQRPPSP
jgi:DNA invertase Pin-like site-specific DNA recombinase